MDSPEVECPSCGIDFELWEIGGYCPNPECGAQHPEARTASEDDTNGVVADIEVGQPDEAIPGDATTIDCPSCGEGVSAESAFCQYCGTELSDNVKQDTESDVQSMTECPSCGVDVTPEQSFCMECGSEILDSSPEESTGGTEAGTTGSGGEIAGMPHNNTESNQLADDSATDSGVSVNENPGSNQLSHVPVITLDVLGEQIRVHDGDLIGTEVRRAMVDAGGEAEKAQYIHREHIEFDVRQDGVYLIDHGQNSTRVNGESLSEGDEQKLEDGDVVELSDVVDARVQIT